MIRRSALNVPSTDTDFVRGDERNASWNVVRTLTCPCPVYFIHILHQIRSEFDNLLLRHAEESGAKVFEETKVTEIKFAETKGPEIRPVSAVYVRKDGEIGQISFEFLVDASGRNGIMSTKVS